MALAAVSEQEQQEIPTLNAEIEALQTTNPTAQLKLAETVKQHLDALIKAFSAIGRFDITRYATALDRFQKAEQQYEKATRESFAELPIPGLLKEEWRRFIQAGEEYLKSLGNAGTYPTNDEECIYCRQPLGQEAVALVKKYRDFFNNDLRLGLETAGRELDGLRRASQQGIDFTDIDRRTAELSGNGAGISAEQFAEIRDFVSKGKAIREAVENRKPVEWADQAAKSASVAKHLEDAQTHNNALLKDLTERRDKREEALKERQGQDSAAEVSGVAALAHGNLQGRKRTAPQP